MAGLVGTKNMKVSFQVQRVPSYPFTSFEEVWGTLLEQMDEEVTRMRAAGFVPDVRTVKIEGHDNWIDVSVQGTRSAS